MPNTYDFLKRQFTSPSKVPPVPLPQPSYHPMPDLSAAIINDWNTPENSVPDMGVRRGNPIEDTLTPGAKQTRQAIKYGSIAGLDDNEPDYGKIKTVNADIARSGNNGYTVTAAKNDTDTPAQATQFSYSPSKPSLYSAPVGPLQGDDEALGAEQQAIIRSTKRDYNTAYSYYQAALSAGDGRAADYWQRKMNESHRAADAARGGANAALSDLVAAANGTVTYNPEKHRATITVNGVEKTAYFYGEDDDTTTANIDGQTFAVHNDHILMNSDQFDKLFGNNAIVNTTSGTQYISSVKSTVAPDKVSVVVTTTFPDMIANNTVYGGKSVDNSFYHVDIEPVNDPYLEPEPEPEPVYPEPVNGDKEGTDSEDSTGVNASDSPSGVDVGSSAPLDVLTPTIPDSVKDLVNLQTNDEKSKYLFGDNYSDKRYYKTAEDAQSNMTEIEVNVWTIDANNNKVASKRYIEVNKNLQRWFLLFLRKFTTTRSVSQFR